jgi:hypothetical protein
VIRIPTAADLEEKLETIADFVRENVMCGLVIIDAISSLFAEYLDNDWSAGNRFG